MPGPAAGMRGSWPRRRCLNRCHLNCAVQASSARRWHEPFVIAVAGGTASGKTTVCDLITQRLHDQCVAVINQDSFYRDLSAEARAAAAAGGAPLSHRSCAPSSFPFLLSVSHVSAVPLARAPLSVHAVALPLTCAPVSAHLVVAFGVLGAHLPRRSASRRFLSVARTRSVASRRVGRSELRGLPIADRSAVFGAPLLNTASSFDHAQLQRGGCLQTTTLTARMPWTSKG